MTEQQREVLEAEYQRWKTAGVGLAGLLEFRKRNGLGEDRWLTEALAADARTKAPAFTPSVRIEPVARVASKPTRSSRRTGRQRRTVDPTKLYYSDLGGDG